MSELQKYRSFILIYNSTTGNFEVGTNGRAYVFNEGASINQAGSLSGAAGTVLAVFDNGSFVGNSTEYAYIGLNATPRLVTAKTSTSLTLGAGAAQTVAIGDRVLNIGTASDKSASGATIYSVDQDTSTPITQPVEADANGNFEFYANTGDYDILIQNSSGTDLYIDPDNSIFILNRNATGGVGSSPVVYLQLATDDFMVGASSPTSSDFYVDVSAGIAYVGPASGSSAYIALDGAGALTIAKGTSPTMRFLATAGSATITASPSGTRTLTLPDATGTLMIASGLNQTVSSNTTFSGTVTISNTTSLSAALQSSSNGYFATGLVVGASTSPAQSKSLDIYRIYANKGTQVDSTAVIATSGWATIAPTASVVATSTDTKMQFTFTAGAGSGTTQVTTVTFKDGAYTQAPICVVVRNGGSAAALTSLGWTTSTTALTITTTTASAITGTCTFTVYTLG